MFYLQYILTFCAISTLLLSNIEESSFKLNSIDENKIDMSFEFYPENFSLTNSYKSINALGFPTFIYTISMPDNINYDIEYDLHSAEILDPLKNNKILFMDGISKNETNTYKEDLIYISNEFIKHNTRYIILSISPYKASETQTVLYKNISIHINTNQTIQFDDLQILTIEETVDILTRNEPQNEISSLLIIAPDGDNINSLVTPLINWKKMKGYKVFYHTLNETGYSNVEIKNFIQNAYDNWEYPPNFICIIGDADGPYAVPTFNENLSLHNGEGDHPYTLLEGDDNVSDVNIGRLSIRSLSDLANISNKIISYEQSPFLNNQSWFKRALCVGDPSMSGISTIITNQIIAELMINNNYDEVLEVYQYPFVNQIENGINLGVSFYNYRGFAGSSGWQKDDADNLSNGYMLPVVSIITCDTGSFLQDEESTTENFLRTGSISIPRGGVAAIGMATQGTHTMFNNCLDYGLYHALFVEKVKTLGEAVTYAKNNLWLNYPDNPNNYVDIFSHWMNLMGDPTLSVWTDLPAPLNMNFESIIPFGQNFLDMEVTSNDEFLNNVLITVTDEEYNLIAQDITNNEGFIKLEFDTGIIDIGTYNITATKNNYIPLINEFNITEVNISMNIEELNIINQDSSSDIQPGDHVVFNFNIHNYGLLEIDNISGEIIFNDTDIIIEDNTFIIENSIPSNNLSSLISIQADIDSSVFHKEVIGEIMIYYEDVEFRFSISFIINGPKLNIANFNNADGDSFLVSDTNNLINFTIQNMGTVSNAIQIELNEDSEYIELENNLLNIPSLENNEILFLEETIGINVAHNAYPGLQIPISILFLSNDEILDTQSYNLPIGQISSHDPLGPDLYGYYMYDNLDIAYDDVPIYNWIEIDPYFSGNGTILINLDDNGENQDDVTFINLPFNFQFYGEAYDQLSISTNGWVKPGLTNQSSFRNWRLPGAGGPSPMIAAFWDDLQTENGRICVEYDPQNHWYIIEWSSVENAFDGSEETFQMIIYDENYFPTLTDDNIIKLQYKIFNNVNSGHYDIYNQWHGNYASIGIENNTANIGLEYTWNNQYSDACSQLENESTLLITTNNPEYLYPPIMIVDALENYSYELYDNQVVSESFSIQNQGEANLYIEIDKDCNESEGLSEPDNYGNAWISSNFEDGPNFIYTDITNNGTTLEFINNDMAIENIPIGFDFPFYDNSYSELLISPNGWIGFENDNYNYVNVPLPSELAPINAIMAFWDDLNPENQANSSGNGSVYYLSTSDSFVVSFENVLHYQIEESDLGIYSFQIILYPSGKIEIAYNSIDGLNDSATIGIQNEDASQYLQINFNSVVVDQTTFEIRQLNNWLSYNISSYVIPGGQEEEVMMNINANQTESNFNECELIIQSNAENIQNIVIPVSLEINQESFLLGDLNFDEELNILDIVTMMQLIIYGPINEQNLSIGDINLDNQLNVLDVVLLVNFILIQ